MRRRVILPPAVEGLITDIQRFCLHDGPGIRTTVFLKGCNLRCAWCHNPETLDPRPQMQFLPEKCIGCGQCAAVCVLGAHITEGRRHVFRRELCVGCGRCALTCYARALTLVGRRMTACRVVEEVLRDRDYYAGSGGGVTLSGGEPLMQIDFVDELLRLCRAAGVHTAVETNLAWPWERIARVAGLVDLFIVDLKAADDGLHRRWAGQGNGAVMENLRRLAGRPMIVRTPVVAGVNDSPAEIGAIARFVASLGAQASYELIAYHPLGTAKYRGLGMPPPQFAAPDRRTMEALAAESRRQGTTPPGRPEAPAATPQSPETASCKAPAPPLV